MSTSIFCTNFGDCDVADDQIRLSSELLTACPFCGKALASPHRVTIEPIPGSVRENTNIEIEVKVKLGNKCLKPLGLTLEVNGKQSGNAQDVVAEPEVNKFQISDLETGLYRIRAVLRTGDERITWSNEQLLLVTEPPNLIAPLLWALLLILLLCLSAGLGLFGKPLFGLTPHKWLTYAVDFISLALVFLIGGLLLDLGRRERASAGKSASLVRPPPLPGDSLRNSALNWAAEKASTGTILVVLGALPFIIALVYAAGLFFDDQQSKAWFAALVAAGGIVVFGVIWSAELQVMSSRFFSKMRSDVPAPAPNAALDFAGAAVPEHAPAAAIAVAKAPGEGGPQPESDKP
jgi:hypothetical protein